MNNFNKIKLLMEKKTKALKYGAKTGSLNERISKIGIAQEHLLKSARGAVYKAKASKPLMFAAGYLAAKQAKFEKFVDRHFVEMPKENKEKESENEELNE